MIAPIHGYVWSSLIWTLSHGRCRQKVHVFFILNWHTNLPLTERMCVCPKRPWKGNKIPDPGYGSDRVTISSSPSPPTRSGLSGREKYSLGRERVTIPPPLNSLPLDRMWIGCTLPPRQDLDRMYPTPSPRQDDLTRMYPTPPPQAGWPGQGTYPHPLWRDEQTTLKTLYYVRGRQWQFYKL